MNKTALGTILGAALLGLAKSKGSSARKMSLDDFFKKKVGNQDQTFKIYFNTSYPAIVDWDVPAGWEVKIRRDFSKYIKDYIEYTKKIVEEFHLFITNDDIVGTDGTSYWYVKEVDPQDEDWMENIDLYSRPDMFDHFHEDSDIDWDIYSFNTIEEWEEAYLLLSKSKIHCSFPEDTSDDKVKDQMREDCVEDMSSWIRGGHLHENIEEWTTDAFVMKLYEEGSVGRYQWENDESHWSDDQDFINVLPDITSNAKSELLDLLNDWEYDLYHPDDGAIYWDDIIECDVDIVLECRLDLETLNVSLNEWHRFIHRIFRFAYEFFTQEQGIQNRTIHLEGIRILKVEPNIWAKKKSNLRKR